MDYRPFHRLLDQSEFEYLRRRGVPESRIRKFRAERRKLFRLCLCNLTRDFNQVQHAIKILLIHSQVDRADLVAVLVQMLRLIHVRMLVGLPDASC